MSWLLRDGDVLARWRTGGGAGRRRCRAPWCFGARRVVQTLTAGRSGPRRGLVRPAELNGGRQALRVRRISVVGPRRVSPPRLGRRRRWWWPRPGRSSAGACRSATASRSGAVTGPAGRRSDPGRRPARAGRYPDRQPRRPVAPGGRRPGRRRRHLLRGHPPDPQAAERGRDPAPRLVAMHQHNEAASAAYAVELARGGATVAVVTDAGMPGISDPGARVVRAGGRDRGGRRGGPRPVGAR